MKNSGYSDGLMSFADYLQREELSETRNEFYYGQMVPRPPSTLNHNLITLNLARALREATKPRGHHVFVLQVRVMLAEQQHCTYPDVMAGCDPSDDLDEYFVRKPEIIVSVLPAETSRLHDPAISFQHYQQLPSLRHYVRVSQLCWAVEYFWRNDHGQWMVTVLTDPEEILSIPSLGLQLPLTEIYHDTHVRPHQAIPGS